MQYLFIISKQVTNLAYLIISLNLLAKDIFIIPDLLPKCHFLFLELEQIMENLTLDLLVLKPGIH